MSHNGSEGVSLTELTAVGELGAERKLAGDRVEYQPKMRRQGYELADS